MLNLLLFRFAGHHYLVLFLVSLNLNHVLSEIIVYKNTAADKVVRVISDYALSMGSDIPDEGIMAYIVSAQPEDACTSINPPPKDPYHKYSNDSRYNWFVLVDRDYCVMDKKLKNVKDAGYNGVIIYNAKLTQLNVPELNYELIVDFPVLLVTHIDGRQIKLFYTYDKDYFVYLYNNSPLIGKAFLLPFLIVIGACIIVIISFMISQIIRCYNERKVRKRHRLAKRHLKKIPTINFKKGDHYEICAICLDEFQEGVKLRLLTCGHAYHLKCIDPWLTENRRLCPICKGKVVVPGITDSESEAENERNQNATERTPLLSNSNGGGQNENLVYSTNNLIFPVGRRVRRSGRSSNASAQSNVPSTSSIVNSSNDLVINVQPPATSSQATGSIPFRSNSTRSDRRRAKAMLMINAEINSPQSSASNLEELTASTSSTIQMDGQSESSSRSARTARSGGRPSSERPNSERPNSERSNERQNNERPNDRPASPGTATAVQPSTSRPARSRWTENNIV